MRTEKEIRDRLKKETPDGKRVLSWVLGTCEKCKGAYSGGWPLGPCKKCGLNGEFDGF